MKEIEKEQINSLVDDSNLVETNIRLITDRTTSCQIVQLIAYIRNIIKNNAQKNINVKIGSKVVNGKLLFDVNGLEIPDLIPMDIVEIN